MSNIPLSPTLTSPDTDEERLAQVHEWLRNSPNIFCKHELTVGGVAERWCVHAYVYNLKVSTEPVAFACSVHENLSIAMWNAVDQVIRQSSGAV